MPINKAMPTIIIAVIQIIYLIDYDALTTKTNQSSTNIPIIYKYAIAVNKIPGETLLSMQMHVQKIIKIQIMS